ncbi:hypothetical protein CASFOL_016402 [Castilleja foliolosa]|uniref:Reverse transcriptase n=1 Tax=Castilleja foliolosa TaxID=1961234 RepID=A0ABD3DK04_9LAMI
MGAPIFKGRAKTIYFEKLIQKIVGKLEGWKGRFLSFSGKITLIKAVLNSLPIHTMTSTAINKGTIKIIDKLIRSFLWSQKGQKRLHWCNWQKVCMHKADGGLGIRSMADTIYGLQGKLAWSIIQKKTIWSKILNQKYITAGKITQRGTDSTMWKCLIPHIQRLLNCSKWLIGKGAINLWTENWFGEVIDPESVSTTTVRQAKHMINSMDNQLSQEQIQYLKEIELDDTTEDQLIYTKTLNGVFSMKNYIDEEKGENTHKPWAPIIWHHNIPSKQAAFLWKLINRAIPVDT